MNGIRKCMWVLLAVFLFVMQENTVVLAAEYENNTTQKEEGPIFEEERESQIILVEKTSGKAAEKTVNVLSSDDRKTVLVKAVDAFKQEILNGAKTGESLAKVAFSFETKDSYDAMLTYITSYLWYAQDWEPEIGLLEMALYNEPELRPYMEYGSTESHFVNVEERTDSLTFVIYWPISYNQVPQNHVSVVRSDGKVEKQEFVVLEDAFLQIEKWNALYGADVDYSIQFLDLCPNMIGPNRDELPEAKSINFYAKTVWMDSEGAATFGIPSSMYIASDLKANSDVSISQMNIRTGDGAAGKNGFTLDLNGNTFSSYGFNDVVLNFKNGDLFAGREDDPDSDINPEQRRPFRIFGNVDINAMHTDYGYFQIECVDVVDSKIQCLDGIDSLYVTGKKGTVSIEKIYTVNTFVFVQPGIELIIGDIIADYADYESATWYSLHLGMPEGIAPKITGRVTDELGNDISLQLVYDPNFYLLDYTADFNFSNEILLNNKILVEAPNVKKVMFSIQHEVYNYNVTDYVKVKGVLSKNENGGFYLKDTYWEGFTPNMFVEIGKDYETMIKLYADGKLVDDTKISSYIYTDWMEGITVEQEGNTYHYSCSKEEHFSGLEYRMEINVDEGVTYWEVPIPVFGQSKVNEIVFPKEKLTHVDGVGDVYLMVLNKGGYHSVIEGLVPTVNADGNYFLFYKSDNEDLIAVDYERGLLCAWDTGICNITAFSGEKEATYKVLAGWCMDQLIPRIDGESVENYSYWPMKVGQKSVASYDLDDDVLEKQYGHSIEWTSSDPTIFTVDSKGKLTAKNEGGATLTYKLTRFDGEVLTTEIPIVVEYDENDVVGRLPVVNKPYKIANVVSGVHVYWENPHEGAEKYGLWRSETKDGEYKWVGNPTVPHFTDTKVVSGKTYYYKVTVCDAATNQHGRMSEAIGIKYVSTPDITSRINKAAGVQLSWNKIDGASGYAIYRKSYKGNESWARIATITDPTKLTYIDGSVKNKNGEVYRYTIRALAGVDNKTLSGCRNTGRTMVRLASRVLNDATKASGTAIKCKWTTSSAVTGYEVRFMTDGKVYKTFTVGNYKTGVKTFTNLPKGKTYKVQVRSYKKVDDVGSFYSAWSQAKNVTLPWLFMKKECYDS